MMTLLTPTAFRLPLLLAGFLALVSDCGAAAELSDEPILAPLAAEVRATASDAVAPEPPGESAKAAVALRYRFQPGQLLRYATTDESVMEVEHGGESATVEYSTRSWKHYRVKSVEPDGSCVLELVLDRVLMSAHGPDMKAEFDSEQPGSPPAQFAHVLDSVGRPVADLKVTQHGVLVETRRPTGRADAGDPLPIHDGDTYAPTVLPERTVVVGDAWTERFEAPVFVDDRKLTRNIKLQRKYTLTEVAGSIATIDLETIVLTPIHDPQLAHQLMQRTPSGVLKFDIERGILLSRRLYLNNQVVGNEGPGSRTRLERTLTEHLEEETSRLTAHAAGDSVD